MIRYSVSAQNVLQYHATEPALNHYRYLASSPVVFDHYALTSTCVTSQTLRSIFEDSHHEREGKAYCSPKQRYMSADLDRLDCIEGLVLKALTSRYNDPIMRWVKLKVSWIVYLPRYAQ